MFDRKIWRIKSLPLTLQIVTLACNSKPQSSDGFIFENKDGFYLIVNRFSGVEKAYIVSNKKCSQVDVGHFKQALKRRNIRELKKEEIEGLKAICKSKLATPEQRQLIKFYDAEIYSIKSNWRLKLKAKHFPIIGKAAKWVFNNRY